MPIDIKVPAVGESIAEGTLARWFKRDGEIVQADEPLFELETEKATTEIAAPAAGTLHIGVPEGQTVAIGAVIGRIEETKGAPAAPRDLPKAASPPAPLPPRKDHQPAVPASSPAKAVPAAPAPLMPAARRLAEQEGVDANQVPGTGRGGRITKDDVQKVVEAQSAKPQAAKKEEIAPRASVPPAAPSGERETRQRMSAIRQRIAERLLASQKASASLTTFNEADLSAVTALRSQYRDRFKEKHGVGLGFMAFFVKACVEALRTYPIVNASIDGQDIVYHHGYDIGIAVSTERGLMVPVLRDAGRLTFAAIEKGIADLAQKARDGKIAVADLRGGTFTITNGGTFGSMLSTPILNPPQSAILGLHAIQKRPAVVNDQVVVRPMMYLALTYDHRLIDGREAVLFLVRVKECIEDPGRLLLEV